MVNQNVSTFKKLQLRPISNLEKKTKSTPKVDLKQMCRVLTASVINL